MIDSINFDIKEDCVLVSVTLVKRISPRQFISVFDEKLARQKLVEAHPSLKVSEHSEVAHILNNKGKDLSATWKFFLIKEPQKIVEKKKTAKKTKKILNFKPKSDKVVETTEPEQTDLAKGVEEPTE
jgi:hypothetical protein